MKNQLKGHSQLAMVYNVDVRMIPLQSKFAYHGDANHTRTKYNKNNMIIKGWEKVHSQTGVSVHDWKSSSQKEIEADF